VGNKVGWILALAVIIVVVGIAYFTIFEPLPSPPRDTLDPSVLTLKSVDMPLADVIGFEPNEPGNAADDYQKAVTLWLMHGKEIEATGDADHFDALAAAKDSWADPGMQACKEIAAHVAAGARKKTMEYTFRYTPKQLKIRYRHKHADHLYKVAVSVQQVYMMHKARMEFPQAEKPLQHMFVLGIHLFQERSLPYVSTTGLDIQLAALKWLQELYNAWPGAPRHRLALIGQYEHQLSVIRELCRKKRQWLWDNIPATDPRTGDPILAPGDVFNIAEHDQDRAWRVQAIIALGPMKYRITGRGDSRKTRKLIEWFLMSKDPLEEAAAQAASKMTQDEFRGLGTADDDEE
jgi:hypothetical protein